MRVLFGDPLHHLSKAFVLHEALDRVVVALQLLVRKERMDGLVAVPATPDGLFAPESFWHQMVLHQMDDRPLAERAGGVRFAGEETYGQRTHLLGHLFEGTSTHDP